MLVDKAIWDFIFSALLGGSCLWAIFAGLRYRPKAIPESEVAICERERRRCLRFAWVLVPTSAALLLACLSILVYTLVLVPQPTPSFWVLNAAIGLFGLGLGANRWLLARAIRQSLERPTLGARQSSGTGLDPSPPAA